MYPNQGQFQPMNQMNPQVNMMQQFMANPAIMAQSMMARKGLKMNGPINSSQDVLQYLMSSGMYNQNDVNTAYQNAMMYVNGGQTPNQGRPF